MTARDAATLRQIQAADPRASTWLSANAGSGKTRVLTDRVARLLLDGVAPTHVLCLTYTKAAAAEMQNRLFRRLGSWAMLPTDDLRAALADLGVEGRLDAQRLAEARRLFARAIETPGGLRIQTIHSFCAGLLRRFPREAGVSPRFTEMEDRAATLLRADVVDAMATGPEAALVAALARDFSGDAIDPLLAEIIGRRDAFAARPDDAALAAMFGLPPGGSLQAHVAAIVTADDLPVLAALRDLCATGSTNDAKAAERLAGLDLTRGPDARMLEVLEGIFLTGEGAKDPYSPKIGSFPTKPTRARAPDLIASVDDLMGRVAAGRDSRLAYLALARTRVLYDFACAFVPAYEAAKLARGLLDFDDLIGRTRALLTDPLVAQWVLYRLDGGIDHILVDEAQDTSPAQWAVIERLAQEMSAGEGAHADRRRTIFVVGDKKQSIYSFQGADPAEFDRMQTDFEGRLADAGQGLVRLTLDHSFRSAAAILRVVDLTFDGAAGAGLGGAVSHIAFKEAMPGRVDLWPVVPKPEKEKDSLPWTAPVDMKSPMNADVQLAEAIAAEIGRMKAEETIPVEDGQTGRYARKKVSEGDILILVQRRSTLFAEIIRACKAAGLQIAGADRLKVGAELAVRDIAALLRFLALPEDDLSLAATLRSPLFGWSEQALFTLAHGRGKRFLWQVLRDRAADHPETMAILDDMRGQADFLRPYDLINRLLLRHDGRRRLLARLGAEAEDGIDALLSQALAYEQAEIPGLTGFVEWMQTDDLEIKRQMDSQGDRIRVMTVHGAKGLEAPIVFLPETQDRPLQLRDALYPAPGGVIWAGPKDRMPATVAAIRAGMVAAQENERRRLLYVAMTRAQCWLIACAAGTAGPESWHGTIATGMTQAGAVAQDHPTGPGLRYQIGDWDGPEQAPAAPDPAPAAPAPPDFGAVTPAVVLRPLSPSDLGGAKTLPGEADPDQVEDAKARGRLVHLLLEHLPGLPPADRIAAGQRLLAAAPDAAGLGALDHLPGEVAALIDRPDLAHVFAADTLAEVDVTADLPELGNRRLQGTIDRLIIAADRITAVDYKTNRLVPASPAEVPEGLLRQMGAYGAMLREIWPDRAITVAILWTATGLLMPIGPQDMAQALSRATGAGSVA